MSEQIVQLNEQVIKTELKELGHVSRRYISFITERHKKVGSPLSVEKTVRSPFKQFWVVIVYNLIMLYISVWRVSILISCLLKYRTSFCIESAKDQVLVF